MSELFQRLLGELRRLGVTVIHADFSSVILYTDKDDLEAAQEYCIFILQTLGKKELFANLTVRNRKNIVR